MSEPTPPGAPAPPPPELAAKESQKEAPPEVKRAATLYTLTAAFLVFVGVSSLFMLKDTERALRQQLNELEDQAPAVALTPEMIRATLIMLGVAIIGVAIGHGLTAQGLRDRKSWSRPVGFTFSGILLAVAAFGTLTGAISLQTLFFLFAGLMCIMALAKPEVRDYLQPFPKAQPGPFQGGWPPGPPPPPPPLRGPEDDQHAGRRDDSAPQ